MKTEASKRKEKPSPESRSDEPSREEMINAYLPFVRLVAEKVHRRLPPGVDLEPLVHSGVVGLLEAFDRYDPRRGVAFQAYARYRIQGEVMQCLRSLDWVSRSVRAWDRKVAAARVKLTGRLGREAVAEELAAELGIPLDEYYRIDYKVNDAKVLSLDDLSITSEDELKRAQEQFVHSPFEDPLNFLERKDLLEKLTAAVEQLPERERMVLTLYHHEELTLREIGEVLDLSEGRICQIYTQAVGRLRQLMGIQKEARTGAAHKQQRKAAGPRERRTPGSVRR